MNVDGFLTSLESTEFAQFVQVSDWAFPAIESVHVVAIVLVVGMIAIVDLRLVGLASRQRPVSEVLRDSLTWVWIAFGVALASGALMFVSAARSYAHNGPFQAKMLIIVLAGLNMLVFELIVVRGIAAWDRGRPP